MTTTDTRELEQVLARTVRQLGEVQASALRAKLPKPFQRPSAELTAMLEALADRGEVFRHPTARTKFLSFDPGAAVRGLVLETLGPKALTEAELKKQVAKKGASLGLAKALGPLTSEALKGLVSEGTAFVHRVPPPPGESKRPAPKTLRYASERPEPVSLRPYVRHVARELKALVKGLTPFGATLADAWKAFAIELGLAPPGLATGNVATINPPPPVAAPVVATTPVPPLEPVAHEPHAKGANGDPGGRNGSSNPADDAGRLLHALDEVATREPAGSLLLVERVREHAGLDKAAFDRAALALAGAERIVLHYHDHPNSLPPAELAELVADGSGTYFIGMARRRGA